MTRWTWGWLGCLVLLVGLVLTVPVSAVAGDEGTQASWSYLGIRRVGDPEALLSVYKLAMLVVGMVLAALVTLDVRGRRRVQTERVSKG